MKTKQIKEGWKKIPDRCSKCGSTMLEHTEDGVKCIACGWIFYQFEPTQNENLTK